MLHTGFRECPFSATHEYMQRRLSQAPPGTCSMSLKSRACSLASAYLLELFREGFVLPVELIARLLLIFGALLTE
jgi:hypothetical protein